MTEDNLMRNNEGMYCSEVAMALYLSLGSVRPIVDCDKPPSGAVTDPKSTKAVGVSYIYFKRFRVC